MLLTSDLGSLKSWITFPDFYNQQIQYQLIFLILKSRAIVQEQRFQYVITYCISIFPRIVCAHIFQRYNWHKTGKSKKESKAFRLSFTVCKLLLDLRIKSHLDGRGYISYTMFGLFEGTKYLRKLLCLLPHKVK